MHPAASGAPSPSDLGSLAQPLASTPARCVACRGCTSALGRRAGFRYVRCKACGTLQLDPLPAQAELEAAYGAESFSAGYFDPAALRLRYGPYYELVAELVAKTPRPDGLVLDFGCGWGGVGEQLVQRGIEQLGIDLSTEGVAVCRTRGLRAEVGDLSMFGTQRELLSAMTAAFVFEHLIDFDVLLADVKRLLIPSGIVVVLIPTPNLVGPTAALLGRLCPERELPAFDKTLTPPWHTVIFSPSGLTQLMRRHGFELVRLVPSPTSRTSGLGRLVRRMLDPVIALGTSVFGPGWPLAFGHAFVFRLRHP